MTVRYHTSLPCNRASIQARWLLAQNPLQDYKGALNSGDPAAVYLWPELPEIDDPVFDPYDIWQVDVSGLAVQASGPYHFFSVEPISPDRLTLLRPAPMTAVVAPR